VVSLYAMALCVTVCLSVCLSQVGLLSKRLNGNANGAAQ